MRHGDDGCGCRSGVVCACGDGSVAGGGVGAPLHAHYVRGCAWECDGGFERDATGNACIKYTLMNDALSWSDANAACLAKGLHLASVHSVAENALLVTAAAGNAVWIRGTDAASEGTWVWSPSGTPLSYTNWNPGEPNNVDNEDCLEVLSYGKWNDLSCTATRKYVCEHRA